MHMADQGRLLRKSIDYLLMAVSGWEQVLNPDLPALFSSILTIHSIKLFYVIGL